MLDMAKEMIQVGLPYEATSVVSFVSSFRTSGEHVAVVATTSQEQKDGSPLMRVFYGFVRPQRAQALVNTLSRRRSVASVTVLGNVA